MKPTEKEYRAMLVKKARRRAAQIRDGSYVNEPWAPNAATRTFTRDVTPKS